MSPRQNDEPTANIVQKEDWTLTSETAKDI